MKRTFPCGLLMILPTIFLTGAHGSPVSIPDEPGAMIGRCPGSEDLPPDSTGGTRAS